MALLHLGQQRDDVLCVGHEHRVAHVVADGPVRLALVDDGAKEVLDVGHAHDAVDILVKHRDARVARAAHERKDAAQGLGVLDGREVDARHHDLAGDGVSQVEDLVNHRLLLVGELVRVRHHVADLLLGDLLAVVGGLDAEKSTQAVGRL